ncbi:hypothetical protein PsYK624_115190 [Phanerochaete sordida]|uniref:Uncharacterized protein n=1 Tax=Phanerochaete sordida TaxID=48140 RepID=A0A9P3LHH6_9APHY|nr:hypothetical protein PsYK624_115190 [Phanerochaete sordida]
MQPPQRIQNHLVKLTVEPHIMQHLELITALPRLSELVVSCFGLDMDTFDSRAAILRTSTGRAIDSITVSYARPEVVELLMRLFVDVQTLRWKWCLIVPDGNPKSLASPLAVRNLEVIGCSGIFLPYVAHMLARERVESLKVELIHHIDGGHEAFLDDFIQWFPHLNAYHHIDISGLSEDIRAYLPGLSRYTALSSAALTTEALDHATYPERFQDVLIFLAALPVGIRRIALVYEISWTTAAELTERVRQADWASVGRAVERYTALEVLEVSVENENVSVPDGEAVSLVETSQAQAVVSAALPERLRSILVFK